MAYLIRKRPLSAADTADPFFADHSRAQDTTKLREPSPAGFPLLFSAAGQLIEPAVAFLHEHTVHRACSEDTLKTYADVLYDWFETMEQFGIDWRSADAADLFGYRNRMLSDPSGHTKRAYSARTINHRVRGVIRFYRWMVAKQWLSGSEIANQETRGLSAPGPVTQRFGLSQAEKSIFTIRQFDDMPRPLAPGQARELLASLRPPFDLMARWQIYTGLRVSELLRLKLSDVSRRPGSEDEHQYIDIVRKGRKRGFIIASKTLLDETEMYVSTYRQARANAGRMAQPQGQPLFLTSRGANPSKNWYQRQISAASRACGFKATTHTLRATFACMMSARLVALALGGDHINPLQIVRDLMGHEHIETTDRYLRAIDVHQASIFEALESLDELSGEV